MIPLAIPNLAGREAEYTRECIETNYVSSVGPFVARFESMVAEVSGVAEAVATSSGTTGLHLALTALGVGRDDLVALPTFTFIASANAISHCGAAPLLLDIDPASWTLDDELLERTLSTEARRDGDRLIHLGTGRRIAALMPVYTLGTPAQMERIHEVSSRHRLPIVADAAAAIGATFRGGSPASLADLAVYSFNGNKTVTCGGGGAVVGGSVELMRRVRHLSSTARIGTDYHHDVVGFNYRMTNLQAAVGCAQMEQLPGFLAAKRGIRARYDRALALPGVGRFPSPPWCESGCWFSGIVVEDPGLPSVAELCAALAREGIEARPFWKPIHLQPPYREAPRGPVAVAERLWDRVLTLPCSTALSEADQDWVIAVLRRLLVQRST